MDDAELERYRSRFATSLDGRWATMGIPSADPGYGVWVFRGGSGHREAKGSLATFRISWSAPRVAQLDWEDGEVDELRYDFEIASDTTRQICLCSRGRAVFAFEVAPLVRLGDF